jgi:hypothetical protein
MFFKTNSPPRTCRSWWRRTHRSWWRCRSRAGRTRGRRLDGWKIAGADVAASSSFGRSWLADYFFSPSGTAGMVSEPHRHCVVSCSSSPPSPLERHPPRREDRGEPGGRVTAGEDGEHCRSGFTTLPPVPLPEQYRCGSFVGGAQIARGVGYPRIRWTRGFTWFRSPERNTLRPRENGVVLLCLSAQLRSSSVYLCVCVCVFVS